MSLPGGGGSVDLGSAHGSVRIDSDTRGVDQAAKAMSNLENKSEATKKKLDNFSLKAGLLGAGIALSVGQAAHAFIGFETQMNAVRAVAGATEEEFKALTDTALRIGRDTSFSASEAAQALEELAKAGVSVDNILHGAADGAVSLAAAAGITIPQAAAFMSTALNQFGLAGDQANRVADIFANVANKSAADAEDFAAALSTVGSSANNLGIPIEDVAAAIAVMADQGSTGALAGQNLAGALRRLVAPTDEARKTMKAYGIQIADSQGEFVGLTSIIEQLGRITAGMSGIERQNLISSIFGEDGLKAINALLNTTNEELQKSGKGWVDYQKAMGETGTAQKAAQTRMAGLSGAIEQLSGSIETARIEFGEKLAPAIRFVAETLTTVVNAIGGLPGPIQSVVAFGAAGAAAFLFLAAAGAKIISIGISTKQTWTQVAVALEESGGAAGFASTQFGRLGASATAANSRVGRLNAGLGGLGKMAAAGFLIPITINFAGDVWEAIDKGGTVGLEAKAENAGLTLGRAFASGLDKIGVDSVADGIRKNMDEREIANEVQNKLKQAGLHLDTGHGLKAPIDVQIKELDNKTIREFIALADEQGISIDELIKKTQDQVGITEKINDANEQQIATMAGLTEEQYAAGKAAGLSVDEMLAQQEAADDAAKAAEEFQGQLKEIAANSVAAIAGMDDIAPDLDGIQKGFVKAGSSSEKLILTMDKLGAVNLSDSARSALELSENLNQVEANIDRTTNAINQNQGDLQMWQSRIGLVTDVLGGNTEELSRYLTMLQNGEITQEQFNAAIEQGALGPFQKLDALLAQGKISQEQYNEARSAGIFLIERSAGGMQDENAELVQNIIDLAGYAAAHDTAAGAVDGLTESQRQLIAATKSDVGQEFLKTIELFKSVGASDEFIQQYIIDSSQADPVIAGLVTDLGLLKEPVNVELTATNADTVLHNIRDVTDASVSLDGKEVVVKVDTDQTALDFAAANADALDGKEVTFIIDGDDGPVVKTLEEIRAEQEQTPIQVPVQASNPDIGFINDATDQVINPPDPVPITAKDETGDAVDSAKQQFTTIPVAAEQAGSDTSAAFAKGVTSAEPDIQESVAGIGTSVANGIQPVVDGGFNYGFNLGYNFSVGFINSIAGFGGPAYNAGFNLAFNALIGAQAALGISSPSREAQLLALNFGGTFLDTFGDQERDAKAAGASFMDSIVGSMANTPAGQSLSQPTAASLGALTASSRPGAIAGANSTSVYAPINVNGVSDPKQAADMVAAQLFDVFSRLDAGGAVTG